jgi:hypothetical protein
MGLKDRMMKAAEAVSAQTSKVGVGASRGQLDIVHRAKRLREAGVETPGRIDAMTPTGKTDAPGGTEYDITLTLSPSSGDPYEVTINQYIYPKYPRAVGNDVIVKVDPDDPTVAMIWALA